jgi:hypothetical protein
MTEPYLSKSKFIAGIQCPKLLWTYYNNKSAIPEPDPGTQAIFDQGHLVGELATSLFPNGIKIDWGTEFDKVNSASTTALAERRPLFEPGFMNGLCYARADVLNPVSGGKWDLIEVKSTTKVEDVHLQDVAFQKYVYEGAGVPIRRCYLMHINNTYVRRGEVDPKKLFKSEDITKQVSSMLPDIPEQVSKMRKIIGSKACPDTKLSGNCDSPYSCPLVDSCRSFLPEQSVFSLYRGGPKKLELIENGILRIVDIPDDFPLTETQQIQVECERSGRAHVDKEAIAGFLGSLQYPLCFLDFETFATAIPVYDLVRPYQQVSFQYSLCILRSPGADIEQLGFLADGTKDPRPEILSRLKSELGKTGSIVAYNATFEIQRLEDCAQYYSEYSEWVRGVIPRFIDLLVPFRSFHYYHPDQLGSASLKAVMPVLTGQGYDELEIGDGGTASLRFLDMAFGNLSKEECAAIRNHLEVYCSQDTRGMIDVLRALKVMISAK